MNFSAFFLNIPNPEFKFFPHCSTTLSLFLNFITKTLFVNVMDTYLKLILPFVTYFIQALYVYLLYVNREVWPVNAIKQCADEAFDFSLLSSLKPFSVFSTLQ